MTAALRLADLAAPTASARDYRDPEGSRALDRLRDDSARITQRGIGMPIAGSLFWLAFAALGWFYPPKTAALLGFFATGAVFPLGWWFTHLAGGNLMPKGHPLNGLGGMLNAVQFFYWPVIILVYALFPNYVPLVFGVLFGSHFLPYGWMYRSAGYLGLGIGAPVVSVMVQMISPANAAWVLPLAVAATYWIAIARIHWENRRAR